MKVKPVVDALDRLGIETILVHTGQHYDVGMSDVFFRDLGLRAPDHWLGAGSGSHAEQTGRVMTAFESVLAAEAPDIVVVPGDVNSTLACALVAAKAGVTVAHVEAGLRSFDRTMPEEVNRVLTDQLSDFLFVPSADGVDNLRAEGIPADRIHLVGNVMADTLLANLERARCRPTLADLGLAAGGYGLVTLHRPTNVDDVGVLADLFEALGRIAAELPLVFPVHPRTARAMAGRQAPAGVRMVDPLGYLDFLALQAGARLVLTDSGGVQEETTILGVPCLTLREQTERPITVTAGTNTVVGRDPVRIVAEARRILSGHRVGGRPELWDGLAGERVAEVLVRAAAGRPDSARAAT